MRRRRLPTVKCEMVTAIYKGGLDSRKDAAIRKAFAGRTDGSGFDLMSGERDVVRTYCGNMKAARNAKTRLHRLKGVRVRVYKGQRTPDGDIDWSFRKR